MLQSNSFLVSRRYGCNRHTGPSGRCFRSENLARLLVQAGRWVRTKPMSKHDTADDKTSVRPIEPTPTDAPLVCVDLALDYAPAFGTTPADDFGAWSAARQCTTDTLRRQLEVA